MGLAKKIASVLLATIFLFGFLWILSDDQPTLIAPNGKIAIEIVSTTELQQKGLSNRESIGQNEGMLFSFPDETINRCFWMKDMNFAIDMVWINSQKQVVYVEENVIPETYPESFCSDEPAQFVLEVKAGRASQLGIAREGVELRF